MTAFFNRMFPAHARLPRLSLVFSIALYAAVALATYALKGEDLSGDEAQYWDWSRNLDWGYYSKPPMVAYIIALVTGVAGNHEIALRLTALFFNLSSFVMLYVLTRRITGRESAAGYSVLLLLAVVAVNGFHMSMTTNEPFYFLWLLAMYLFYRATEGEPTLYPLSGAAIGLAALSRFTGLILAPSFLLYAAWKRGDAFRRPALYTMPILAIASMGGILAWNIEHDWVTLRHTATLGVENPTEIPPAWQSFLMYFVTQALSAHPVLYIYYVVLTLAALRKAPSDHRIAFLLCCGLPLYVLYAGVAPTRFVEAHWTTTAYFAGMVGLSWWWSTVKAFSWKTLPLWITLLSIPLSNANQLMNHRPLTSGRIISAYVEERFPNGLPEDAFVFSDVRNLTSQAAFYLPGNPRTHLIDIGNRKYSQYDFWAEWDSLRGKDALFITWAGDTLAKEKIAFMLETNTFEDAQLLGFVQCRDTPISFAWCKNFQGPPKVAPKGMY